MTKEFLQKDSLGKWNTNPPVPKELLKNINCHKFALYFLGKITREEMISDPSKQKAEGLDFTYGIQALAISSIAFVPIKTADELMNFAKRACNIGEIYVGQILDAETSEAAHSFIVERNEKGFVCFDKAGFKTDFGVYEIKDLFQYENYHNQKWRFVPLKEIS